MCIMCITIYKCCIPCGFQRYSDTHKECLDCFYGPQAHDVSFSFTCYISLPLKYAPI
jgi:hypothetical protein